MQPKWLGGKFEDDCSVHTDLQPEYEHPGSRSGHIREGHFFFIKKNQARTHLQGMFPPCLIRTLNNETIGMGLYMVWLMALLS